MRKNLMRGKVHGSLLAASNPKISFERNFGLRAGEVHGTTPCLRQWIVTCVLTTV
jgi:hypothetical protein